MTKVLAVCQSKKKGTRKETIPEGQLDREYGLVGDAHADSSTHRQVSLVAIESINKMRDRGFDVGPGDFAENLTIEGMELAALPVGTRLLVSDDIVLEITQIGKECHTRCAIYHQIGECIMPKEGVFARVLSGGTVHPGDRITIDNNGK